MTPAGQRDKRIVFERATSARGALGVKTAQAWTVLGRRSAKVLYGTGAERRAAAVEGAVLSATFRVLADSLTRGVTAEDRIAHIGLKWDITGTVPIGRSEIELTATTARG